MQLFLFVNFYYYVTVIPVSIYAIDLLASSYEFDEPLITTQQAFQLIRPRPGSNENNEKAQEKTKEVKVETVPSLPPPHPAHPTKLIVSTLTANRPLQQIVKTIQSGDIEEEQLSTEVPSTTISISEIILATLNDSSVFNQPTANYNKALLDNLLENTVVNETQEVPEVTVDAASSGPADLHEANVTYDSTIQIEPANSAAEEAIVNLVGKITNQTNELEMTTTMQPQQPTVTSTNNEEIVLGAIVEQPEEKAPAVQEINEDDLIKLLLESAEENASVTTEGNSENDTLQSILNSLSQGDAEKINKLQSGLVEITLPNPGFTLEQNFSSMQNAGSAAISPEVAQFLELLDQKAQSGRKVPTIVEVQEITLNNTTPNIQENVEDQGTKNDSKTLTKVLGGLTSFAEKLAEMQQKNPDYFKPNGTSDSVSDTTSMFGTGNEQNHSNVRIPVTEMQVTALPIKSSSLAMTKSNRTKFASTKDVLEVLVKILPDLLLKKLISISNKKGKYVHEVGGKIENNPNIKMAKQANGLENSLSTNFEQSNNLDASKETKIGPNLNTNAQQSVRPGSSPLKILLNHFSNMQSKLAAAQQQLKPNQTGDADAILTAQIGSPIALDGEKVEDAEPNELTPIEATAVIIPSNGDLSVNKETKPTKTETTSMIEIEQIRDADENIDDESNSENEVKDGTQSGDNFERDNDKETRENENQAEQPSETSKDKERSDAESESAKDLASEKEERTDEKGSDASRGAASKDSEERSNLDSEDNESERDETTTSTTTTKTTTKPTTTTTTLPTTTTTESTTPTNRGTKRNESQAEANDQSKKELPSSSQSEKHLDHKSDKLHAERDIPEDQFVVKNGSQTMLHKLNDNVFEAELNSDNFAVKINPANSSLTIQIDKSKAENDNNNKPSYILDVDQYGNPLRSGGGYFLSDAFDKFSSLTKSAAKELKSVPKKIHNTVKISKNRREKNDQTNRRDNKKRFDELEERNDENSFDERSRNKDNTNLHEQNSEDKRNNHGRSYSHFGDEWFKERSKIDDMNDKENINSRDRDQFGERSSFSNDDKDYPNNRRDGALDDFDNESERDQLFIERKDVENNDRYERDNYQNYRNHERDENDRHDRYSGERDSSERGYSDNDDNDDSEDVSNESDNNDDDEENIDVNSRTEFDDNSDNERSDRSYANSRLSKDNNRAQNERENVNSEQQLNNEESRRIPQTWRPRANHRRRKNFNRRLKNERGRNQSSWDKMDPNLQEKSYQPKEMNKNKPNANFREKLEKDREINQNWDVN